MIDAAALKPPAAATPTKSPLSTVPTDPLLVDARELARLLSVSAATIWRLDAAAKLPAPVKLGGSTRWRYRELIDWAAVGCPDRATWASTQSDEDRGGLPQRGRSERP